MIICKRKVKDEVSNVFYKFNEYEILTKTLEQKEERELLLTKDKEL
jgi:hypothetical protein